MPTKKLKVHFIGIGGIGVSALARYYLSQAHEISGSDLVSSEITEALKKLGVKISIGKNTIPENADLVIYSPAVSFSHPELLQAKNYKLKTLSYPEALGELTKKYFTIAVSGTHGKSTTTAMIGLLLAKAGLNPTVIVGTKLKEFGDSNFRPGGKPVINVARTLLLRRNVLVIEADEHMASFLNYWPKIIVLTTIEADHLDYYKNLKNILRAFRKYISHLPDDGVLVASKDDKNIRKILKSKSQNPNFKINPNLKIQNYSLKQPEAKRLKRLLKIPGEHNVANALAALAVARILKIPDKISFKTLSEYRGSWRRFETTKILYPKSYTLISDYGHHPTEVRVTLKAARERYPDKKIWCVFQPHQYQRTFLLFKKFVRALRQASVDKLVITGIYDVAGRETPEMKKKVSGRKLAKEINQNKTIYLPKEKIESHLKDNLKGGEVVVIMGAGDIYNLSLNLLKSNNVKHDGSKRRTE